MNFRTQMKGLLVSVLNIAVLTLSFSAIAADLKSPVGNWRSIDDVSRKPRSYLEVSETPNKSLEVRIKKVLPIDDKPLKTICTACTGELKDKPLVGMRVAWGLKPSKNEWTGGEILDPKNGKVYRCKMELIENGAKLKVRGYIGFSIFGRTQIWERMSDN